MRPSKLDDANIEKEISNHDKGRVRWAKNLHKEKEEVTNVWALACSLVTVKPVRGRTLSRIYGPARFNESPCCIGIRDQNSGGAGKRTAEWHLKALVR